MARYTGAVCRLCRREGQKLFLKGERCYTDKCGYDRGAATAGHARPGPEQEALRVRRAAPREAEGQAVYGIWRASSGAYF
jgi:small subunit ribosomal protein S4